MLVEPHQKGRDPGGRGLCTECRDAIRPLVASAFAKHGDPVNSKHDIAGGDARPRVLDFPDTDKFLTLPSHLLIDPEDWLPLETSAQDRWYPDGAWEAARIARTYDLRSVVVLDTLEHADGSEDPQPRIVGHHGLSRDHVPFLQSRELLRRLRNGGSWLPMEDGMFPEMAPQGVVRHFGAKVIVVNGRSSQIQAPNDPFLLMGVETLLEVVSFRSTVSF